MKKYLSALSLFLLFVALSGCNNYGKKKNFNALQLYHTDKVTDAEADSLGNYLVGQKFADSKPITIQLTKSADTLQVRLVVKDGMDKDAKYIKTIQAFASMLSKDVFNAAPLEMHMCDDQLNTLKVLVANAYGKKKIFDGVELYHTKNVTDVEADSLGNYLVSSKFADGTGKSAQITKSGDTYQFKFFVKSGMEKDTAYMQAVRAFAVQLSKDVFKGAPVDVFLCDGYFYTLTDVPMDDGAK